MANCFLVKFPSGWSRAKREELTERIDKQCFLQLLTYKNENQVEFMFEQNNQTAESFRARFEIPPECEIVDISHWRH